MSDEKYYVEFPEVAVNALKQGDWVVIEFKGLYCKVIPYPIEEQIADELGDQEVVFKFEGKRKTNSNSP